MAKGAKKTEREQRLNSTKLKREEEEDGERTKRGVRESRISSA